jgi:hypothetical protein
MPGAQYCWRMIVIAVDIRPASFSSKDAVVRSEGTPFPVAAMPGWSAQAA